MKHHFLNIKSFVRLIKSASLNYCSKLIEYMPTLNEEFSLKDIINSANLGGSFNKILNVIS